MNCSPTIAIALTLLALAAGMFLLYKTQKENLNVFFRIISWGIIVVSIGCLLCCSVRCIFHGCRIKKGCEMEQCGPGVGCAKMDRCSFEGGREEKGRHFEKRVMIYKGGEGECEAGNMAGCCKEGKECGEESEKCSEATSGKCCKEEGEEGHEKMSVVKDTVIIKRSTSK